MTAYIDLTAKKDVETIFKEEIQITFYIDSREGDCRIDLETTDEFYIKNSDDGIRFRYDQFDKFYEAVQKAKELIDEAKAKQ